MHPVLQLFDQLKDFQYPSEVTAPPRMLPKTAFFPGGYGLWKPSAEQELPQWPQKGIMVLGHNFSSEEEWNQRISSNNGDILDQGMWPHLLSLLDRVGIKREQCFFTNAYMGLGDKQVGNFSGAKNSEFVRACQTFFQIQVLIQQPRLILALGRPVHKFLSEASAIQGKLTSWCSPLRQLDKSAAGPVVDNVRFDLFSDDFSTVVTALVHTANRPTPTCVGMRQYHGWSSDDAELAMLNDAMKSASFQTWKLVCDRCETESFLFPCEECKPRGQRGNSYKYNSLITGVVTNNNCCPICNAQVTKFVCPNCRQVGQVCAA